MLPREHPLWGRIPDKSWQTPRKRTTWGASHGRASAKVWWTDILTVDVKSSSSPVLGGAVLAFGGEKGREPTHKADWESRSVTEHLCFLPYPAFTSPEIRKLGE